jgi:hypothetical protein
LLVKKEFYASLPIDAARQINLMKQGEQLAMLLLPIGAEPRSSCTRCSIFDKRLNE